MKVTYHENILQNAEVRAHALSNVLGECSEEHHRDLSVPRILALGQLGVSAKQYFIIF
jgi:hypothetical protein